MDVKRHLTSSLAIAFLTLSAGACSEDPTAPANTAETGREIECQELEGDIAGRLYVLAERSFACRLTQQGDVIVDQGDVKILHREVAASRIIDPAIYPTIDVGSLASDLGEGKDERMLKLPGEVEARLFWADGRETYVEWTEPLGEKHLLVSIVVGREVSPGQLAGLLIQLQLATVSRPDS